MKGEEKEDEGRRKMGQKGKRSLHREKQRQIGKS
jgi:hypothetical protein